MGCEEIRTLEFEEEKNDMKSSILSLPENNNIPAPRLNNNPYEINKMEPNYNAYKQKRIINNNIKENSEEDSKKKEMDLKISQITEEGLIKRRAHGILDKEMNDFEDCLISNEEELQNQVKYYIQTYIKKNEKEIEKNLDDGILTHTFCPDFTTECMIVVNGMHVKRIEHINGTFCLFYENIPKSKHYYEAFILNKIDGIVQLSYSPDGYEYHPTIKPEFLNE